MFGGGFKPKKEDKKHGESENIEHRIMTEAPEEISKLLGKSISEFIEKSKGDGVKVYGINEEQFPYFEDIEHELYVEDSPNGPMKFFTERTIDPKSFIARLEKFSSETGNELPELKAIAAFYERDTIKKDLLKNGLPPDMAENITMFVTPNLGDDDDKDVYNFLLSMQFSMLTTYRRNKMLLERSEICSESKLMKMKKADIVKEYKRLIRVTEDGSTEYLKISRDLQLLMLASAKLLSAEESDQYNASFFACLVEKMVNVVSSAKEYPLIANKHARSLLRTIMFKLSEKYIGQIKGDTLPATVNMFASDFIDDEAKDEIKETFLKSAPDGSEELFSDGSSEKK